MATFFDTAVGLVRKALVGGSSRGVVSDYIPGVAHTYGRENRVNNSPSDVFGTITPERMREIVLKTPTASAALNTIMDYASGVEIKVRNIDPAKPAPTRAAKLLREKLRRPQPGRTGKKWRRALIRDMVTMGYGACEYVGNDLHLVDAARLRIDFDEHGTVLGYNMYNATGQIIIGDDGIHTWTPDQLAFYPLDGQSASPFPTSRIAQLFACAVIEALMMQFIGARFTDGNVPFGLLDLGDLSEEELDTAIHIWNEQIAEKSHPEHRLIITGSRGGANYVKFGYNLAELEAPKLMALVRLYILGILGVTPNELGESDDVNKANGYNLSYTFKKRAIEPVLDTFVEITTTSYVHDRLGFTDTELHYEEIDSRDELLQGQIDDLHLKAGVVSINQVRNRRGDPSIKGGDEPAIQLGTSVIPVSMIGDFAKVQLEALQMLNKQTQIGILQVLQAMATPQIGPDGQPLPPPDLQPLASMPLMRGMQPPERFTTIDGRGSSTPKFQEPKPAMQTTPQRARGAVQANRNQGLRKEDTTG